MAFSLGVCLCVAVVWPIVGGFAGGIRLVTRRLNYGEIAQGARIKRVMTKTRRHHAGIGCIIYGGRNITLIGLGALDCLWVRLLRRQGWEIGGAKCVEWWRGAERRGFFTCFGLAIAGDDNSPSRNGGIHVHRKEVY